jgi:hypothetical protein
MKFPFQSIFVEIYYIIIFFYSNSEISLEQILLVTYENSLRSDKFEISYLI